MLGSIILGNLALLGVTLLILVLVGEGATATSFVVDVLEYMQKGGDWLMERITEYTPSFLRWFLSIPWF